MPAQLASYQARTNPDHKRGEFLSGTQRTQGDIWGLHNLYRGPIEDSRAGYNFEKLTDFRFFQNVHHRRRGAAQTKTSTYIDSQISQAQGRTLSFLQMPRITKDPLFEKHNCVMTLWVTLQTSYVRSAGGRSLNLFPKHRL